MQLVVNVADVDAIVIAIAATIVVIVTVTATYRNAITVTVAMLSAIASTVTIAVSNSMSRVTSDDVLCMGGFGLSVLIQCRSGRWADWALEALWASIGSPSGSMEDISMNGVSGSFSLERLTSRTSARVVGRPEVGDRLGPAWLNPSVRAASHPAPVARPLPPRHP